MVKPSVRKVRASCDASRVATDPGRIKRTIINHGKRVRRLKLLILPFPCAVWWGLELTIPGLFILRRAIPSETSSPLLTSRYRTIVFDPRVLRTATVLKRLCFCSGNRLIWYVCNCMRLPSPIFVTWCPRRARWLVEILPFSSWTFFADLQIFQIVSRSQRARASSQYARSDDIQTEFFQTA